MTEIQIPGSVSSIGYGAFSDCSSLAEIQIPSSVTSIGDSAFSGCSSLTEIQIPNSVSSIGDSAFSCCSGLTKIEILSGVTSIGDSAFDYCSSLTEIQIPSSVSSIGGWAFYGCSSLMEIQIPSSVSSIGRYTFFDCSSLTEIQIPSSVSSIGDSAFSGCSSLTEIQIPNSVSSIGDSAFSCCSSLTKIEIPSGVTSIGIQAFIFCSSLTEIQIPTSVTSIGRQAFEETAYSENENNWKAGVLYLDGWVLDGRYLTEVKIEEGTKGIADDAFSWCRDLTKIEIPSSVTSIGEHALGYNRYYTGYDYEYELIDDFKIHCYPDSAAYEYAIDNGIPYILIETNMEGSLSIKTGTGEVAELGDVEMNIFSDGEELPMAIQEDGTYVISGLSDGTYIMKVSKPTYATRSYSFTVSNGEAESIDVELHHIGDIDGDGRANMKDLNRICDHIRGKNELTDYEFSCADISGDGKSVNAQDLNRICDYVRNKTSLWN